MCWFPLYKIVIWTCLGVYPSFRHPYSERGRNLTDLFRVSHPVVEKVISPVEVSLCTTCLTHTHRFPQQTPLQQASLQGIFEEHWPRAPNHIGYFPGLVAKMIHFPHDLIATSWGNSGTYPENMPDKPHIPPFILIHFGWNPVLALGHCWTLLDIVGHCCLLVPCENIWKYMKMDNTGLIPQQRWSRFRASKGFVKPALSAGQCTDQWPLNFFCGFFSFFSFFSFFPLRVCYPNPWLNGSESRQFRV